MLHNSWESMVHRFAQKEEHSSAFRYAKDEYLRREIGWRQRKALRCGWNFQNLTILYDALDKWQLSYEWPVNSCKKPVHKGWSKGRMEIIIEYHQNWDGSERSCTNGSFCSQQKKKTFWKHRKKNNLKGEIREIIWSTDARWVYPMPCKN